MAEVESPDVTTEEKLVPVRGAGMPMLERLIADPDLALKKVEAMVKVLEQLRTASIRATYPSDWIIHTTITRDGEIIKQVGYLQDSGAERAGKVWGIEVGSPAIEREDFADGTYSYHMITDAWSKVTGERLDYTEGSRWSGDPFFARQIKTDGDRIDPTDVRKASYANLHGRAVRALSGLNGVPIDMLRQAGLDITKVVHVNYEKGAKGGESTGASAGSAEVVVAFGNSRGKRPAELENKDLAWYVKAYRENVADPDKAKFIKANQRVLDALTAEQERRAQAAAHEAETGTKAPATAGGDPLAGTSRGRLLGDVQALFSDATGKQQRLVAPILRLLCKEWGTAERMGLSDFTDEELGKIAAIPSAILTALAEQVKGGAK